MYQCFVFGHSNNDIAIGSSQLDLGGKQYFLSIVSITFLSNKINFLYLHMIYINLFINLIDFEPDITAISEYQLIHPNQPLVLDCSATGSPRPVLQWLHDGNVIVSFYFSAKKILLDGKCFTYDLHILHKIKSPWF